MAPDGLTNRVLEAVYTIDLGRNGLATDGEEHEGRISYEKGLASAMSAFRDAQNSADTGVMLLVELTYSQQELEFCDERDAAARNSLTQAIQSFEDALRCLKTVENPAAYGFAETAFPTAPGYRIKGFPRDAVHLACSAHWTRLQNSLRAPGINMTEKDVLRQRAANMKTLPGCYLGKQKKALGEA